MKIKRLKDGVACGEPGCLKCVTHPCFACNRVAGHNLVAIAARHAKFVEAVRGLSDNVAYRLRHNRIDAETLSFCGVIRDELDAILAEHGAKP